MNDITIPSWYVARRVEVPAETAGPSLDHIAGDELRLSGRWGELAVTAASTGLIRSRAAPHRRLRGSLHLPRRRAARVELELTPWSVDACELGIRPESVPRGDRGHVYLAAASAALEALGAKIVTTVSRSSADRRALEQAS